MQIHYDSVIGLSSTIGASILAVVPSPEVIDSLAKWPAVVVLGAVACYSIYSMNKTADRAAKAQDNLAASVNKLVNNLNQRPCIRHPDND